MEAVAKLHAPLPGTESRQGMACPPPRGGVTITLGGVVHVPGVWHTTCGGVAHILGVWCAACEGVAPSAHGAQWRVSGGAPRWHPTAPSVPPPVHRGSVDPTDTLPCAILDDHRPPTQSNQFPFRTTKITPCCIYSASLNALRCQPPTFLLP